MTVYLLGGSSTVMSGGWADSFALRMMRRQPVRNLAIGGGNTLMSLIRLKQEVALAPGDTLVWANSVADVKCLSSGGYTDGCLLRYTEELVRHAALAGAGFVPLLIDSLRRDMDKLQPSYKQALLGLLDHYGLDWIDVTAEFGRETGLPRIPLGFYDATAHIAAGSEMTHFIADLVGAAIAEGRIEPRLAAPRHIDPRRAVQIVTEFAPADHVDTFENRVLRQTLWKPGLSLPPDMRPGGSVDLEALLVMADPAGGAFDLKTPDRTVTLSASCAVDYYNGPMLLTAYLRALIGGPLRLGPEASVRLDWAENAEDMRADLLFHPEPELKQSRARLAAMVFREAA
jgi:hypothetical protein